MSLHEVRNNFHLQFIRCNFPTNWTLNQLKEVTAKEKLALKQLERTNPYLLRHKAAHLGTKSGF